jgi:hypothetical protein
VWKNSSKKRTFKRNLYLKNLLYYILKGDIKNRFLTRMKKIFTLLLIFNISVLGFTPADTIKAKIAILHRAGEIYNPLKTRDRLRAGEMLRIFVLPITNCFAYIIHSSDGESTLLGKAEVKAGRDTLILPNPHDFYVFDEAGVEEKMTIICSVEKLNEIESLFKKQKYTSAQLWKRVETKIISQNKPNLGETSDKPFPMAGNVSSVNENFIEAMNHFEGNKVIIRKYEIEIKK